MWCGSMGEAEREAARMNPDAFAARLDAFRALVDRGDKAAAVTALETCLTFGLPVPDWLAGDVREAMRLYFEKGGAAKQGGKGNLAQTRRSRIDVERYRVVERERERPGATLPDALSAAAAALRGTFAKGSVGQIEASYLRMAAIYRTERRRPGPKPRQG